MTYDCFTFFNELDLLEIRLNVLKNVVDRFVICEAPWTHTGHPKPLIFAENKARFAAFADRIIYVVADEPPLEPNATPRENAWRRENAQRNQLIRGLVDLQPDDTILISDLDEIPRPEAVAQITGQSGVTRFGMRFYNFFLNFRNYSVLNWPIGTQACTWATFNDPATFATFAGDEYASKADNEGATLTKLRMAGTTRTLKDAGWHFSFLGGEEAIIAKFKAFAHTEQNTARTTSPEEIRRMLNGCRSALLRGYSFFADPIDESFPAYIRENVARYAALIRPVDAALLRRTALPRLLARLRGFGYCMIVRCIPPFLVPLALRIRSIIHHLRFGSAIVQ